MTVALRCDAADGREFAASLRGSAKSLLRLLDRDRAELSIVLTTDAAIRQLNSLFRGKDSPTDVLSFPQLGDGQGSHECGENSRGRAAETRAGAADAGPPVILGDVVISIATALRQAQAMRLPPERRLRALLIHGLLHLLGYDHERSRAEARRMFARERELAALLDSRPAPRRLRSATVRL
ncbi:MAG TPA: rRNA maturation RNase YbeY [Candidatus Binataceae bacterium]|nr:rRNA maturation RNase YbeY [Candidatus Binataceae bacterium]